MNNPLIWLGHNWFWLALVAAAVLMAAYFFLSGRGSLDGLKRLNLKLQQQLDSLLGVEDRLKIKQRESEEIKSGYEHEVKDLHEEKKEAEREARRTLEKTAALEKKLAHAQAQIAALSGQIIKLQEDSQRSQQELKKVNDLAAELIVMRDDALARLKEAQNKLVKTERLAAVSAMVISLNHEINNPLTSVSLSIQNLRSRLAADKPMPRAEILSLLDISNRETERIKNIIAKVRNIGDLEEVDYLPGVKMISLADKPGGGPDKKS